MSSSSDSLSRSGSRSSSEPPSPDGTMRHTADTLVQDTNTRATDAYANSGRRLAKSPSGLQATEAAGQVEVSVTKQRQVGHEIYIQFERQAMKLDEELRTLCNKARKLGSSAGIVSASVRLRDGLSRVLHVFQKNAKSLYPVNIGAHIAKVPNPLSSTPQRKASTTSVNQEKKVPEITVDSMHPGEVSKLLAEELRLFSEEVQNLFDCFKQFPEFVDEIPDSSIAHDLETFADFIHSHEDDSDRLAMRHFLDDAMGDLGNYLESLSRRFVPFTTIGIPTVKAAQDLRINNLENQTVVATLFAGIATAMLQIYTSTSSALSTTLVIMWYMCLIFSIGSTVNGLLALSWTQAILSPDSHIPWWVRISIKSFPLVFLILAITCSFVAIILIGFLPDQNRATLVVTTVLSATLCLGLLAVSGWFICELLVFKYLRGKVWLIDIMSYLKENRRDEGQLASHDFDFKLSDLHAIIPFWESHDKSAMTVQDIARHRWREAIRRVVQEIRYSRRGTPLSIPSQGLKHMTNLPLETLRFQEREEKLEKMKKTSYESVTPKRAGLCPSLRFSPNGDFLLACDMRLTNPRGYLRRVSPSATAGLRELDFGTSSYFVWSNDSQHVLVISNRKLTVWTLNYIGSAQDMDPRKSIEYLAPNGEDNKLKSAAWNGDSQAFYFVQGKKVMMVQMHKNHENKSPRSLQEDDLKEIDFAASHSEIRSICVSSDAPSRWMILRTIKNHQEGIVEGKRSIQSHGIAVWDLIGQRVAAQIRVYHKISDVALSLDNERILISYANRSPTQYWRLTTDQYGTHLRLRRSYYAMNVEFAPFPSIFGGENDNSVLRATKEGDIYVWDCMSAELLHRISIWRDLPGKELVALSWNAGISKTGHYMFAVGMHDGEIQVWESPSDTKSENSEPNRPAALPMSDRQNIGSSTRTSSHRYSTPGGSEFGGYSTTPVSSVSTKTGRML